MFFTPGRRKRRIKLACIVVLLAGVCMLLPAAASGHRRGRLESQVSEEAAAGALQETTGSPATPESLPESDEPGGRSHRRERRERRDARERGGCTPALQAPRIVTSEATPTLTGALSCTEPEEAGGQTVTLYQKLVGVPGFEQAATTTTETSGQFQFPLSGLGLNSIFYVRVDGAKSARIRVQLAPTVIIASPTEDTPLFSGGESRAARAGTLTSSAVSFSGTVSPAEPGATVILQREFKDGGWLSIGAGNVEAEGSYSIVHTFSKPGEVNIRVVLRSHHLYMKSASQPVTYTISRRKASPTTIQASADPLAYGAALELTGTIAGPPNQAVTLFAQAADGAFVPVEKKLAVGDAYSFSQSPLQSTRYRVATTRASSPLLAETVVYAVSPSPAPSEVITGEQVVFTGEVAPADEGQPVKLERESLSGLGGYHAVATGAVSASGAYSLAYTFHAIGSALLRISVPGDSEIGTADSEPFELAVTPAA
ncbi:MAG: hypothetical protein ACRDJX_00780 [Solirubrobacteraceae bacterium]